ncbi:MAG: hypothetical protein IID46_10205 [Planctomycetes bacterium]|nr:hypothetical protein [Planctomycetota bacterium]
MQTSSNLRRSVITSSSTRTLDNLFSEVLAVRGDIEFDLIVLRDIDIRTIEQACGKLAPPRSGSQDSRTYTEIMAEPSNFDKIRKWIIDTCQRHSGVKIPALATYFPDVTSLYQYRRDKAVDALKNTVLLALSLVEEKISSSAIVEVVCGTILDPCECSKCDPNHKSKPDCEPRIFISDRDTKLKWLLDSLDRAVEKVKEELRSKGKDVDVPFAIGIELEPGDIPQKIG